MENIIIKNYSDTAATVLGEGTNKFSVKPIVDGSDISLCAANFVEVEPSCSAYGYHYHEANEEVFYIISGTATVKTPQGEIEVPAGSAIAFPANENGAHIVMNNGSKLLRYIDFGTRNAPDLVHFAGTGSGWACSATGKIYTFTEN